MPTGRSDVANAAVRMFLQQLGVAYDHARGLEPFRKAAHFPSVCQFFKGRCCYCGRQLGDEQARATQDHLIPINRTAMGLHAWGNVVPACRQCNADKHGGDWREFVLERSGADAHERFTVMKSFLAEYPYDPPLEQYRQLADALYVEAGAVVTVLIQAKVDRSTGIG